MSCGMLVIGKTNTVVVTCLNLIDIYKDEWRLKKCLF